jgi:hypothetical protein
MIIRQARSNSLFDTSPNQGPVEFMTGDDDEPIFKLGKGFQFLQPLVTARP